MNPAVLIVGPVALVVVAISVVMLLRPLGQIIRIRRVATAPVGALADAGPAEVFGRADGDAQPSPIGQAPCVFWQVEVQEYRSTGKSGHWRTIFRQASIEPFAIDDDTGRVQVLPAGAELTLVDDVRASRGLFGNMTEEMLAALERMGIPTTGFLGFNRRLRVFERRIEPGEQVYALGYVERMGGQPLIRSVPDAPLLLADRSERELLLSLYARVAIGALVPLLILGVGVFVLLAIGGRP
jgi:hypothetical protein